MAHADTLYWYSSSNTDWINVSNWWKDSNHTIHATNFPQSSDDAVILGTVAPIENMDAIGWQEPNSTDVGTTGISIIASGYNSILNSISGTTGTIVFGQISNNNSNIDIQDSITGNIVVYGNNFLDGNNVTGNAAFYDTSYNNGGSITGSVVFNGTSINANGSITGNTTFNGASHNANGTIIGNAVFNGSSYNNGTVTGNATFNYITATAGTAIDVTGYANGIVNGLTLDSQGAVITNWIFQGGYYDHHNSGTVTGDAVFNGSSYNNGTVTGKATFNYNPYTTMLRFSTTTKVVTVNTSASYSFNMFDKLGNPCSTCTYSVSVNPSSAVTSNKSSNQVTGNFTPTRVGTYSLIATVIDPAGNKATENDLFFVIKSGGSIASSTQTYYIRSAIPTNNSIKGNGNDTGILLLNAPLATENRYCTIWIQNMIDQLPVNLPLSSQVSKIDMSVWFSTQNPVNNYASLGVERFSTYDNVIDQSTIIPNSNSQGTTTFSNLNWTMNSLASWYLQTAKIVDPGNNIQWQSTVAQPSTIKYNYQYTSSPLVETASSTNNNILLISATMLDNATSSASILLSNPNSVSSSTALYMPGFSYPFLNASSVLDSSGNSIVMTPVIGANASTTLNGVNLSIVPNAGTINVSNVSLYNSYNYPAQWTESGTGAATATHVIGGLSPNTSYAISVSGTAGTVVSGINGTVCSNNKCSSNPSGILSFNYTGGYSTHTFYFAPASDATLSNLIISQGILSPTFSSSTFSYTDSIPNGVTSLTIAPVASNPNAAITVNGVAIVSGSTGGPVMLNVGNNTITIVVTAQDGTTTDTYTINAIVAPAVSISSNTSGGSVSIATLTTLLAPSTSTTAYLNSLQAISDKNNAALQKNRNVTNYSFSHDLRVGSASPDVTDLQKWLNTHGYLIARSGPGSSGMETNIFGKLTRSALIKFQISHNIHPAVGYFGPITRNVMNSSN